MSETIGTSGGAPGYYGQPVWKVADLPHLLKRLAELVPHRFLVYTKPKPFDTGTLTVYSIYTLCREFEIYEQELNEYAPYVQAACAEEIHGRYGWDYTLAAFTKPDGCYAFARIMHLVPAPDDYEGWVTSNAPGMDWALLVSEGVEANREDVALAGALVMALESRAGATPEPVPSPAREP